MQILTWNQLNSQQQQQALARAVSINNSQLQTEVKNIISNVKTYGDKALLDYTKRFDGVHLDSLMVSQQEFSTIDQLSTSEKNAILSAVENIRTFHQLAYPQDLELTRAGITLGKSYRAIEKVGLYVPGGSAPLVSTLLMLAIPASIAGCSTKILTTPANKNGEINPAILFAAKECAIDVIYKVGGAQAIAAMAYGTQSIPKTYKIFGPGNKYVTEAKQQVAQSYDGAAFDMPAGPSEVLIIADTKANPKFIASDLLAQAEHDAVAQSILITNCAKLAQQVDEEVQIQLINLSRKDIIQQALQTSSIIIVEDLKQAFAIANNYAPEHLILQIENAKQYLSQVINAGSVFLGPWTPESVGDYASGTNHVLPTYSYAKMYSGLDVLAFMKSISYQELDQDGIRKLGPIVETLAALEHLDAHKNAVSTRLNYLIGELKCNG